MISIHLRGSVRAFATLTTELSVSHASGSRTIDCVVSKRSREGIESPDDCCADRKKTSTRQPRRMHENYFEAGSFRQLKYFREADTFNCFSLLHLAKRQFSSLTTGALTEEGSRYD